MIVSKFGGTSVESFEAMSRSAQIIADNPNRSWIVLSATAGTTNDLLRLFSLPSNTSIVDTLFHAPSPIPVKALMPHKGQIRSAYVRLPLELNDLKSETLQTPIEVDKVLQGWGS